MRRTWPAQSANQGNMIFETLGQNGAPSCEPIPSPRLIPLQVPGVMNSRQPACLEGNWIMPNGVCTPSCQEGYQSNHPSFTCNLAEDHLREGRNRLAICLLWLLPFRFHKTKGLNTPSYWRFLSLFLVNIQF